jgi:hypothetical protein
LLDRIKAKREALAVKKTPAKSTTVKKRQHNVKMVAGGMMITKDR